MAIHGISAVRHEIIRSLEMRFSGVLLYEVSFSLILWYTNFQSHRLIYKDIKMCSSSFWY